MKRSKRPRSPRDYKVEKVIETVKILEALEGTAFEPIHVRTIIERVGVLPELDRELKLDAVNRILITLELLGWAKRNDRNQWMLGSRILRFSNRYSELVIASTLK